MVYWEAGFWFFKRLRGFRQPVGAVKAPTGPLTPGSGATTPFLWKPDPDVRIGDIVYVSILILLILINRKNSKNANETSLQDGESAMV